MVVVKSWVRCNSLMREGAFESTLSAYPLRRFTDSVKWKIVELIWCIGEIEPHTALFVREKISFFY